MPEAHHRKPFTYEIQTSSFDANHQLGIGVTLHAQMPSMDVRVFRHAERVHRIDGPYCPVDPKLIAIAVEDAVEKVNNKYWDAVHQWQRDTIKGESH